LAAKNIETFLEHPTALKNFLKSYECETNYCIKIIIETVREIT
jgi:hypothetical protein